MATKINIKRFLEQAMEFDVHSISFKKGESSKRFREALDQYIQDNYTVGIEFKDRSHGVSLMYNMHGVKIIFK